MRGCSPPSATHVLMRLRRVAPPLSSSMNGESPVSLRILPGLTTDPVFDWRRKVAEIDECGLREISLFPTWLEPAERAELYAALERTAIEAIPHVHLRHDVDRMEADYLIRRFHTEVFNIHAYDATIDFLRANPDLQAMTYVENTRALDEPFLRALPLCAGLCVDFTHLHDYWVLRRVPEYDGFDEYLAQYPIGCCHIGAIRDKLWFVDGEMAYESHYMEDISQLEYLRAHLHLLPDLVSIELINGLSEQTAVVEFIRRAMA